MRLMFPVIGGAAIFPLLRGHGLPGGGLAAGVTIVTAFILQYMAHGMTWVEARLHVMPVRWMGFGFPLAGCTGVAACVLRCPFLTSYFAYAELPLVAAHGERLPFQHWRVAARGRCHGADAGSQSRINRCVATEVRPRSDKACDRRRKRV
jgi:hypothetical protein